MGIYYLFFSLYLFVFLLIFFSSFIVRYFPLKRSPHLSAVMRTFSILILCNLVVLLWMSGFLPLLVKITGTAGFIVLFVLTVKSIKCKKLSLFEKWIIAPPYYASIYFGYLFIKLKYLSFFPYAQKVICPACYRLNKPKDSVLYEQQNYRDSFCVRSEDNVFTFNRDDPFYRYDHGRLRFGRKQRFCTFCGETLMESGPYMRLVCIFGDTVTKEWDNQTLVLKNPDMSHRESPIALSALYIDPAAADVKKLESFITFIMNYLEKGRPETLQVYYYGNLTPLGDHMKNLLKNSFKRLKRE